MAIPYVFGAVKSSDFTVTPVKVNKKYIVHKSDLYSGSQPTTASGYKIWDAVHTSEVLKLGTGRTYPTNSFDGTYQHIIWKSIDARYYRFPYDPYATFEHANERFTFKYLGYSASVFVAPQSDFGEGIKPGSVVITNGDYNINLQDDGHGNLYSIDDSTSSYTDPSRIIGYWGFNDLFKRFDMGSNVAKDSIPYISRLFRPNDSIIRNISFTDGSDTGGTLGGLVANFTGTSSIYTSHVPEFNPQSDFSIAFFINFPVSQSHTSTTSTVISKCGTIEKQVLGYEDKYSANGEAINVKFVSSSRVNESTDVYPYKFDATNYNHAATSSVIFSRSSGVDTVSLSSHVGTGWHHVTFTKSGSLLSLYVDAALSITGSDRLTGTDNRHSLIFGAYDLSARNQFSGSLDEIRFYDYALDSAEIGQIGLVGQNAFQTQVVGNVFYKQGIIVISPLNRSKFQYTFDSTSPWQVEYRNTHTIYQWETLIRIPKGSFNLTQNPSALKNPYTDLLRNEFTSSNDDNTGLSPYFTAVGLYNDNKELMAVAKLSQPVKKRTDVDLNVLIRWDT